MSATPQGGSLDLAQQLIRDMSRAPYYDYQLDGIGQIRINQSVAANTNLVIPHTLGRIPNRVEILDNGANFIPALKRAAAWTAFVPGTPGTVTIQTNGALVNAIVRIG
jgi:hypothetical protein